jgi:hypothetical protein
MFERIPLTIEETDIVLIDETTVSETEHWISSCEQCADQTPIAFDYLLDALTGCDPQITEYVMCRPARCPFCDSEITEKTLVSV